METLDFINLGDGVWLFLFDIAVMLVLAAILLTASRIFSETRVNFSTVRIALPRARPDLRTLRPRQGVWNRTTPKPFLS